MSIIQKILQSSVCRVLGHRWHFLYVRDTAGKVYTCHRCCREATFIR